MELHHGKLLEEVEKRDHSQQVFFRKMGPPLMLDESENTNSDFGINMHVHGI